MKNYPIILKVYNSTSYRNEVEIQVYEKAYPILKEFLPQIYYIEKKELKPGYSWSLSSKYAARLLSPQNI